MDDTAITGYQALGRGYSSIPLHPSSPPTIPPQLVPLPQHPSLVNATVGAQLTTMALL